MSTLPAILMLAAAIAGCSKSNSADGGNPGGSTTTTTTTDTYKDPAAYGTPFSGVPDTKDMVMYEVNLRSFSADHSFKGVQNRLDSIKALGVNTVWLMPTYPVGVLKSAGGLGSPYSVRDYNGVNTEFGTLDDLRALVSAAHAKNMAVVLDWVANHTSWDNAWIGNKTWYQQDASGNIISPIGTGWTDVAALNYNNTDLRTAMIRAMKYWILTANIDGYRCDAADYVPTDFWKQSIDTLKKFTTRKLIYLCEGSKQDQFTAGFQMDYAFDFYGTLKGIFAGTSAPSAIFTTNTNENAITSPTSAFKLRYITNHDVTSSDGAAITVYKGKQGEQAAFVLATYLGGVPLIYNGAEVGCPKQINFFNDDPIDWTTNPDITAEFKKILAFRSANEAVKTGALTTYNNTDVIAFEKLSGASDVLVLVNARNSVINYTIPASLQNTNWVNGLSNSNVSLGATYTFQPYGYLVLKRK